AASGLAFGQVVVGGDLARRQRDRLRTVRLAQGVALTSVYRQPAAQVGQGEGGLAVSSVGGPDQVEKGVVLADGQKRAVAERPAHGREVAGEDPDLADEGRAHCLASVLRRLKTAS